MTTEDIEHDARVDPETRKNLAANAYTSGVCVPLIHDGELIGSFNLIYPPGAVLRDSERMMVGALGKPERERVVIQVSDRGCGIAAEHISRIFEPFFTARAGGTGLGLAVSHSIVHRHGGRLSVESELGEGTTFTIELPALRPAEREPSRRVGGRAQN